VPPSSGPADRGGEVLLTHTDDKDRQCESLQGIGIFERPYDVVGEIIVADVNPATVLRWCSLPAAHWPDTIAVRW
jgi:hypothetical protein